MSTIGPQSSTQQSLPGTPREPIAELRFAIAAERDEWGGPSNARHFPAASALHLALADLLQQEHDLHIDDIANGTDDSANCGTWPHAVKIARIINGSAS